MKFFKVYMDSGIVVGHHTFSEAMELARSKINSREGFDPVDVILQEYCDVVMPEIPERTFDQHAMCILLNNLAAYTGLAGTDQAHINDLAIKLTEELNKPELPF